MKFYGIAGVVMLAGVAGVALAQGAAQMSPGMWETTTEIVDMKMQGLPANVPPAMLDRFKPKPVTVRQCITPEQAANPKAEMMAAQKDGKCDVSRMDMAGGKIDIAMVCTEARGGRADIKMTGNFTASSYTMNGDMKMAGQQGMTMDMKSRTTGKRVGACTS